MKPDRLRLDKSKARSESLISFRAVLEAMELRHELKIRDSFLWEMKIIAYAVCIKWRQWSAKLNTTLANGTG